MESKLNKEDLESILRSAFYGYATMQEHPQGDTFVISKKDFNEYIDRMTNFIYPQVSE